MPAARVTDDHLVVPASVVDPVVVTFDGQYVWSFSPRRDGSRSIGGWQVPWPEILHDRLDGTTGVRLAEGETVLFDEPVAFGGNPDALELVDAHGHRIAVDRAGHLTRIFAETGDDVRRHIAEGTARAIADLREKVGVDAHVSYGTLLGAVRDGRMIGHDTDTDLAYLSRFTHPADVVRESYRIEREMRDLGWKVVRMSAADLKLFLPLPDGAVVQVDVFGAFHVGDVFYLMGARSGSVPRSAIVPLSTVELEGVEVAAPADPEAMLSFLYGAGWRVPDPSFQNVDPGTGVRRIEGWMRGVRKDLSEWNVIFRQRRGELPRKGSPFAVWTRRRIPPDATVIDLGSGTGRDSAWFTRYRHRVVAADYSGAALRYSRGAMSRQGDASPDVRAVAFNDLRAVLLLGAELARLPEPPYLFARDLVGCLDRDARANLWLLCSMALRAGGSLHLEYPASRVGLRPWTTERLVRRRRTAKLVREITEAGGRVVHVEHDVSEDFFGAPEPHAARLEVRWDHSPPTSHAGGTVFEDVVSEAPTTRGKALARKALSIPARLRDLEASVQENRRLNRRIAELTDVVAELLVPIADRDEAKVAEVLAKYRDSTFAS